MAMPTGAHDNDAIMALGPHLRLAVYGTPDPEFNDIDPGGSIDWAVSAVQTLTITSTPTGGTFTISFTDPATGTVYTTAGIAYNASAATVQTALEALTGIAPGDVTCTGGALPGTPVVCTFTGDLASTDIALMTADGASLTGGTAPAAAIAETVEGYGYSEPILFSAEPKVSFVEKADDFRPLFSPFRTHDVIIEKGVDTVKAEIAQRSVAALQYALGAVTRTTVAAAADQVGVDIISANADSTPTYYRAALVQPSPSGGFFIVFLSKVRFVGELEKAMGYGMDKTPLMIKCFADENNSYETFTIAEQTADADS